MEYKLLSEIFDNYYNDYFKKYQDIIDIMNTNKDINSICNITQKEISKKLNISQSLVSKCLIRLEIFDKCIEKIKPGIYKINQTDLLNNGPHKVFRKYLYFSVFTDDFLIKSWDEKAILVGVSKEEIIITASYFNMFIHENKEQLKKLVDDIEEKVNNIKLKEVF